MFLIIILQFIICHSISTGSGPAVLRFDRSRAGLCMDLLVFVYRNNSIKPGGGGAYSKLDLQEGGLFERGDLFERGRLFKKKLS